LTNSANHYATPPTPRTPRTPPVLIVTLPAATALGRLQLAIDILLPARGCGKQ